MSHYIIIAGSRDFNNYEFLRKTMDDYFEVEKVKNPGKNIKNDVCIITGGARGADSIGASYASNSFLAHSTMNANWDKYGNSAGYIRNKEILEVAKKGDRRTLVAFWDGVSRGTKSMIDLATNAGFEVIVVEYKPDITMFIGELHYLSNFYESPMEFLGIKYRNAESAFQAQKETDYNKRKRFSNMSGKEAKATGRIVQLDPRWEERKDSIMYDILLEKFHNPDLKFRLLSTDDRIIIEGNTWHDNEWGKCICSACEDKPYQNKLGNLLMRVRQELRDETVFTNMDESNVLIACVTLMKELLIKRFEFENCNIVSGEATQVITSIFNTPLSETPVDREQELYSFDLYDKVNGNNFEVAGDEEGWAISMTREFDDNNYSKYQAIIDLKGIEVTLYVPIYNDDFDTDCYMFAVNQVLRRLAELLYINEDLGFHPQKRDEYTGELLSNYSGKGSLENRHVKMTFMDLPKKETL